MPRSDATHRASESEWRAWLDDVLAISDPETANRAITSAHHRLSQALADVLGPDAGANFHTWAVWGSREAGRTIGQRDIPGLRWRVCILAAGVGAALGGAIAGVVGATVASCTFGTVAALVAHRLLVQAGRAIAHGNQIVLDEIGGVTARFVASAGTDAGNGSEFEAFLGTLRPGPTAAGGQDLLRGAFSAYRRACGESDRARRHQLVFAGNCLAVWHEHVRLQPDIATAIPSVLHHSITRRLLHFWVGSEPLHVGRDLTPTSRTAWPPTLTGLHVPLAVAVVAALRDPRRPADDLRGSAAEDWTVLHQRMNYVVDLFRSRHLSAAVFDAPYAASSPDAIARVTTQQSQQPRPVVALDEDARDVGDERVAEHRHRQPPRVPDEEHRSEREDAPVGAFGPPGLGEEPLEVGTVVAGHPPFREAASEQRARLRQGVLPGLDAQDPLVGAAVALEAPQGQHPVAA
jgi:hypothetical protein